MADNLSLPQVSQNAFNHLGLCLKTAHMGVWEASLTKVPFGLSDLKWDQEVRNMHGIPPAEENPPSEWFCKNVHSEDLLLLREKMPPPFGKQNYSKTMTHVYRVRWANEEIHHIEIYASLEDLGPNENKVSIYGVAKDITQDILKQKLIEDQKNHLLSAAHMAVLGEISSGIAHEINNPLTVIQARSFQLTQMAEHGNLDTAKIKSAAESISKTGDKIAKIVKSFRAFAQGHENEPIDSVNVKQLIRETLDFCKTRFSNHGIEIRLGDIPEDLEFECRLIQIEEALLNIFNNAHDAIAALQDKWILIEALDKEAHIEIQITDSGKGIPSTIADNMMLPFFTTKEIGKGMGLGLSITAEIINKHHGVFFLDPTNAHTKFVIRIPKLQPDGPSYS